MNYIDEIAEDIYFAAHPDRIRSQDSWKLFGGYEIILYRMYAVILLSKAENTALEDVHNCWSAWQAALDPNHRSLIPFNDLTKEVQDLDKPYQVAILKIAEERGI